MSPAYSPVRPGFGRTTLRILLLSGLCSCVNHYHFVNEPKTWLEAQKYCREKYTDLASMENMEDMNRVMAAAGSGYVGTVWIGLYDDPDNWFWSIRSHNFYGPGEWNYRKWGQGEPNDLLGLKSICVYVLQGLWYDYDCDEPHTFICYNEIHQVGLSATAAVRYVYVDDKKSRLSAWAYCYSRQLNLASVRNDNENYIISQVVPHDQNVTIGLYRIPWKSWSNGHSSFRYWAAGHPTSLGKSCAASVMDSTHRGKWVDISCNEKLHFMCQHDQLDPKHVYKVKLTAQQSTIDLNDPAVMEAILNLLEKKKRKGD